LNPIEIDFKMAERPLNELPLTYVKGVGPKRAEALAKEGIVSPMDLIRYFPKDYINRDSSQTLASIKQFLSSSEIDLFDEPSQIRKTEYSFVVDVVKTQSRTLRNRKKLFALTVSDESKVNATINFWANAHFFEKQYKVDQKLLISGKPELSKYGLQFSHPEIDIIDKHELEEFKDEGILPLYRIPTTFIKVGLRNRPLREIIKICLDAHLNEIQETLDQKILKAEGVLGLQEATEHLHYPPNLEQLQHANKRFKFEEMLFYQLSILSQVRDFVETEKAIPLGQKLSKAKELLGSFPFELTEDQRNALNTIWSRLKSDIPMNVLLQGDVGSGKTIVAFVSMMMAVDSGCQTLIMAPTEILAKQHYKSLQKILPDGVTTELLVGGMKKKEKSEALAKIAAGLTNIIIGTHAVFQDKVAYSNLAYVVIDEQHRFGVDQRSMLRELGKISGDKTTVPHILLMTATPIPRTLAMTKYTDLEVIQIKEKPALRKEILTKVRFENSLPKIYKFIDDEVSKGRQAYIVYPLVEESEKLADLKSATEHYVKLDKEVFPNHKCGLLHGKMHWKEKDEVMQEFADGKYDILISTTVIEVGIDVPNSTIILIENAERFGLSQLHQLRGRVGRGEHQSYCILVGSEKYKNPYKLKLADIPAVRRLSALETTSDGFDLSEIDLELRGPGDFLGTKQSGLPDFMFVDIVEDVNIIGDAKHLAHQIIENNFDSLERTKRTFDKNKEKTQYITIG